MARKNLLFLTDKEEWKVLLNAAEKQLRRYKKQRKQISGRITECQRQLRIIRKALKR